MTLPFECQTDLRANPANRIIYAFAGRHHCFALMEQGFPKVLPAKSYSLASCAECRVLDPAVFAAFDQFRRKWVGTARAAASWRLACTSAVVGKDGRVRLRRRTLSAGVMILLFSGCSRSPEVQEARYMEKGRKELQQKNYAIAVLHFGGS